MSVAIRHERNFNGMSTSWKLQQEEHARELFHQALLKQWGEVKDIDAAIPKYRAAANFGFAGAQNNLGDCYEQGRGVPQSDLAAMYWFTRAAERGEPTAFLSLANMLDKTQADEATLVEALKFASLAWLYLPDGGNKDLAKVLEEVIAAKLSPEECQRAYEMTSSWQPLYQEEFLLSDSPEFTPMSADRSDDAGD